MPPSRLAEKLKKLGLSQEDSAGSASCSPAAAKKKLLHFRVFFPLPPFEGIHFNALKAGKNLYNFTGLLLGVGGKQLQKIKQESNARVEVVNAQGNLNGTHPDPLDADLHALITADSLAKLQKATDLVCKVLAPTNAEFEPVRAEPGGSARLTVMRPPKDTAAGHGKSKPSAVTSSSNKPRSSMDGSSSSSSGGGGSLRAMPPSPALTPVTPAGNPGGRGHFAASSSGPSSCCSSRAPTPSPSSALHSCSASAEPCRAREGCLRASSGAGCCGSSADGSKDAHDGHLEDGFLLPPAALSPGPNTPPLAIDWPALPSGDVAASTNSGSSSSKHGNVPSSSMSAASDNSSTAQKGHIPPPVSSRQANVSSSTAHSSQEEGSGCHELAALEKPAQTLRHDQPHCPPAHVYPPLQLQQPQPPHAVDWPQAPALGLHEGHQLTPAAALQCSSAAVSPCAATPCLDMPAVTRHGIEESSAAEVSGGAAWTTQRLIAGPDGEQAGSGVCARAAGLDGSSAAEHALLSPLTPCAQQYHQHHQHQQQQEQHLGAAAAGGHSSCAVGQLGDSSGTGNAFTYGISLNAGTADSGLGSGLSSATAAELPIYVPDVLHPQPGDLDLLQLRQRAGLVSQACLHHSAGDVTPCGCPGGVTQPLSVPATASCSTHSAGGCTPTTVGLARLSTAGMSPMMLGGPDGAAQLAAFQYHQQQQQQQQQQHQQHVLMVQEQQRTQQMRAVAQAAAAAYHGTEGVNSLGTSLPYDGGVCLSALQPMGLGGSSWGVTTQDAQTAAVAAAASSAFGTPCLEPALLMGAGGGDTPAAGGGGWVGHHHSHHSSAAGLPIQAGRSIW